MEILDLEVLCTELLVEFLTLSTLILSYTGTVELHNGRKNGQPKFSTILEFSTIMDFCVVQGNELSSADRV